MIKKIENLAKALRDIGVKADIEYNAEWYCIDSKLHYGIELTTNMYDSDYEFIRFIFTPDGKRIENCTEAPIKEFSNN